MSVMLFIFTFIVIVSFQLALEYRRKKKRILEPVFALPLATEENASSEVLKSFDEPDGIFYTGSHLWAFLEMNGSVKVGLDRFFQRIVGKIDAIEVPGLGENVEQNTRILKVHSSNRHVNVQFPLEGKVVAVNREVLKDPSVLLREPFQKGWILRMKPGNFEEILQTLKFGKEAKRWMAAEIRKLRELLSSRMPQTEPALLTKQDGGLPAQGIGEMTDRDTWANIKKEFFGDES